MRSSRLGVFSGLVLVIGVALIVVGLVSGTVWLLVAGVVGALPAVANQMARGAGGEAVDRDDPTHQTIRTWGVPTRSVSLFRPETWRKQSKADSTD